MKKLNTYFTEGEIFEEVKSNEAEAEELLNGNPDKLELFLQKLECYLQFAPKFGSTLTEVPTLISMVRAYVFKQYTAVPVCIITAIICCLIYVLSPADLIPDVLTAIGYVDDAGAVVVTTKIAKPDIIQYKEWQKENGLRTESNILAELLEAGGIGKKAVA